MSERLITRRMIGLGLALSLGLTACGTMPEQSNNQTPPTTELGDPFFSPKIEYDGQGQAKVELYSGFFNYTAYYSCIGQILVARMGDSLSQIHPFPGCDNGILEPGELERIYEEVPTPSIPR